ncbi:MAG: hypothetical protein IH840_10105 [Candidatus Heimdallarchaeota archaeon]|nr:hypothetical protein [Candidatus Heimdallarchaeota archaeon]
MYLPVDEIDPEFALLIIFNVTGIGILNEIEIFDEQISFIYGPNGNDSQPGLRYDGNWRPVQNDDALPWNCSCLLSKKKIQWGQSKS